MSRSLFARLAQKFDPSLNPASRREFLKATLASSAGLLLSGGAVQAQPQEAKGRHVIVIGAGFAGLACAHELQSVGYKVTLVEPRRRVSGRVLSFDDFVPGKNVEGGGELIGSNHPTWVAYAEKFGLKFIDVTEDESLEMPVILGGQQLDAEGVEKLYEEMDASLNSLNSLAADILEDEPWKSPKAEEQDKLNVRGWIDRLECSETTKLAIEVQLASDNGAATKEQGLLGLLTAIKGGQLEKYWTDSEIYRCGGGNMQLATKLSEAIGADHILLNLPASEVKVKSSGVEVICRDGRSISGDDVVLAVPPSVWRKIEFTPELPAALRTQMGISLKFLAAFKEPFWEKNGLSQYSLSDGMVSQTWELTDNQREGEGAGLIGFSGGPAGIQCSNLQPETADQAYAEAMEKLYPGYKENVLRTRFMNWPKDPWTLAGYSTPAPGQITRIGPTYLAGRGRLHFAGEHTCYKFVGYMEGGLNSGATVAKRIAKRDGVIS